MTDDKTVWQVGMIIKALILVNKKAPVLVNKKTILGGIRGTYLSRGSLPTILKILWRRDLRNWWQSMKKSQNH